MAKFFTPEGRLSFPALYDVSTFVNPDGTTTQEYCATLVFPDLDAIKEILEVTEACVQEKWPKLTLKDVKNPFRSWKEKLNEDGEPALGYPEGCVFMKFKRRPDKGPPAVVRNKGGALHGIPKEEGIVFGGVYGMVSYSPYLWNPPGVGKGCSLSLYTFVLTRTGEPFSSGVINSEEEFAGANVPEYVADEHPNAQVTGEVMDDDTPF